MENLRRTLGRALLILLVVATAVYVLVMSTLAYAFVSFFLT